MVKIKTQLPVKSFLATFRFTGRLSETNCSCFTTADVEVVEKVRFKVSPGQNEKNPAVLILCCSFLVRWT